MTDVTVVLMIHAMQMRGLPINRVEDILDDLNRLNVYGVDDSVDKNNLY